jgi:hypothetical protein
LPQGLTYIHTPMCHSALEVHYLLGKPMLEGYIILISNYYT